MHKCQPSTICFNVAEFVIKGLHYSASEVLGHDHRAQLYYFLQDFLRYKQNQDNWADTLRSSSAWSEVLDLEQKTLCEPWSMEITRKALHLIT